MNEAICVHLYGDGSRNNRLTVVTVSDNEQVLETTEFV